MRLNLTRLFVIIWLFPVLVSKAELIGYWAFEEANGDAFDSVANWRGQVMNATRVAGRVGQALHFNGVNAYVMVGGIGSKLDLTGTAYTLAWWQRWAGPNGKNQEIIAMDDGADYSGGYAVFMYGSPGGGGSAFAPVTAAHNNGQNQHWNSGIIASNAWQHIAITFDGTTRRSYLNGQLIDSVGTSGTLASDGDDPLVFGAVDAPCCGGMVNFFNGDLDEIRIYNHSLSSTEIAQLAASPSDLEILQQPKDQKIAINQSAMFDVVINSNGGTNLTYQWLKDGQDIPAATNDTFRTDLIPDPGSFTFQVRISNGEKQIISQPATLRVVTTIIPGLLARWSFDEESGDQANDSELRFPGTISNAMRIPGQIGSGALRFNGTNSFVNVGATGSDLQLAGSPYTVSWWQRWNGPNGKLQQILAMDDGADYSGGYAAYLDQSRTFFALHNNNSGDSRFALAGIPTNQWQHFAVTFDGSVRKIYVDGTLAEQLPTPIPIVSDGDDPLLLGALNAPCCGGIVNFFSGDLDEVRLYNVALSPQEVADLGPPPAIVVIVAPQNWHVGKNVSVQLNVSAYATAGLQVSYQWQVNGVDILNATESSIVVSNSVPGSYFYRAKLMAGNLISFSPEGELRVVENTNPRLVAHWTFDETSEITAADSVDSFDATIVNGQHVLGRIGYGALEFTGTDSYSMIEALQTQNSDLELVGTPYTIAWWSKLKGSQPTRSILNMQDRLNAPKSGFFIDLSSTSLTSGHGSSIWNIATAVQSTNWNHFALVWDGLKRSLFVNGNLRGSFSTPNALISQGNTPLFMGTRDPSVAGMRGAIDDLRIYNYALASDEIAGLLIPPPPPVLQITSSGSSGLTLSWLNNSTNSFRLEFTEQLGSGWNPSGEIPAVSGDTNSVTISLTQTNRFFRLRSL